jgi:hypothetical protein
MRGARLGGLSRAGRMVAAAAAAVLVAAGLAWCVAVIIHLAFLRRWLNRAGPEGSGGGAEHSGSAWRARPCSGRCHGRARSGLRTGETASPVRR